MVENKNSIVNKQVRMLLNDSTTIYMRTFIQTNVYIFHARIIKLVNKCVYNLYKVFSKFSSTHLKKKKKN